MNDSSNPLRFRTLPLVFELLAPFVVQAAAILALLLITFGDHFNTIVALIASVIWLKMSNDKSVQEFGELRAGRRLFALIGRWFDRDDAQEQFDKVLAETLMFEHSIEHEDYLALVTAKGMANLVRGALSFLLQAYLLVVAALVILGFFRA